MRSLDQWVTAFTETHLDIEPGTMRVLPMPALVDVLEDLVIPSLGKSSDGGGCGDRTAAEPDWAPGALLSEIRSEVQADYVRLQLRSRSPIRYMPLKQLIRVWWKFYRDSLPTLKEQEGWQRRFESWAAAVPRQWKKRVEVLVPAHCFECGQLRGARDGEEFHAVIYSYDRDDVEGTVELWCRACETPLASGIEEVRHAAEVMLGFAPVIP